MPDDVLAGDALAAELRALGRELDVRPPDPAAMAARVRSRLAAGDQARSRAGTVRWLRYAAAALVVAFAVLVAGSAQVRAAIAEFLRFGGVVVEHGGPPPPSTAPTGTAPSSTPAAAGTPVAGVAAAQQRVPFAVRVPAELGSPTR